MRIDKILLKFVYDNNFPEIDIKTFSTSSNSRTVLLKKTKKKGYANKYDVMYRLGVRRKVAHCLIKLIII